MAAPTRPLVEAVRAPLDDAGIDAMMLAWDRAAEATGGAGARLPARAPLPALPARMPSDAPQTPLHAPRFGGTPAPQPSMLDRTVAHLQRKATDPLGATGLSPSGRMVPLPWEKSAEGAESAGPDGADAAPREKPVEAPLSAERGALQMACASDCGCAKCSAGKKDDLLNTLGIQREARPGAGPPSVDAGEVRSRLGAGSPLPGPVAQRFSNAYGRDLSGVRVHEGHALADRLGARAFTVGRDVAFAPGEYRPGTPEGDRLIGHELAHVVQQAGGEGTLQGAGLSENAYEREADHAADEALAGRRMPALSAVGRPAVQRLLVPGGAPAHDVGQRGNDAGPPAPAKDAGGLPPGGSPSPAPAPGVTPGPLGPPPTCDPADASLLDTEVVELKGTGTFEPSARLGAYLWCMSPDPFPVKVQFGDLASGTISVRARGPRSFETTDPWPYLPMTHPAFPKGSVSLLAYVKGSVVTGRLIWGRVATPHTTVTTITTTTDYFFFSKTTTTTIVSTHFHKSDLIPTENEMGWKGLKDLRMTPVINDLSDGTLTYGAFFDFMLDGEFEGDGYFAVVDADQAFEASAAISADGVPEKDMKLERAADSTIFGAVDLSYTLDPTDALGGKLSGSLAGSFANGKMSITGTANYKSDKLSGSVTILLADEATAWANTLLQMPASAQGTANPGMLDANKHVVVGWGTLDFQFNDWLTGTASVVLDPQGYITSHGAIRPQKSYTFLTDDTLAARKQLGPTISASGFKPVWGPTSITGEIEGALFAAGRVGPGKIHDMELSGVFSTRPDVDISVTLSGVVDLSALARLELQLTGSLSYTAVGPYGKLVSLTVGVTGTGTLKVYARLEPSFTVTRKPGGDFQFNMHAVLKAAAAVVLGLKGSVKPAVVNIGPTIKLDGFQWQLGQLGVKSTLDYTIGDTSTIGLDFEDYTFNPAEFNDQAAKLLDRKAEKDALKGKEHVTEVQGDSAPERTPAPLLPPAKHTFTMNGVTHHLWLDVDETPVVKMASGGEGPLSGKLGAEKAVLKKEEEHAAPGTEQNLVRAEQGEVKSLLAQTAAVESSALKMQAQDKPTPDVAGLGELARAVGTYGDQFQKTDLAQPAETPGASPEETLKEFEERAVRRIQFHVNVCDKEMNEAWDNKAPAGQKHTDCNAPGLSGELIKSGRMKGKPVTVAMELGNWKQQCVYDRMNAVPDKPIEGKGKFVGHTVTVEKRYNPDGTPFKKGSWTGTLRPDLVMHGPGDKLGAVYDLKFPCPSEAGKEGEWRDDQYEKYERAFKPVVPGLIYPKGSD